MEENNINIEYTFPDKPKIDNNSSLWKSIGSVFLFIGVYYLYFDQDINYILILVLVLFIHELGHFIAMKYFNYKDIKMFFIPLLGALVTGNKHEISQKQRAIILLAGPVPGIIIGIILYAFAKENNYENIIATANIFIFLNVFNLLPLTPLDGGNLIGTLFFNKKETIQTIFIVLSAIGLVIIAIYLESYILLIIPFFLLSGISHQSKIKKIKANLEKDGIDYNKPFEELTNKEYWLIREKIVLNLISFKKVQPKEYSESKQEKQIVNHIKSLMIKMPILDLSRKAKTVFLLTWILFCIVPFITVGYIIESKEPIKLTTEEYRHQMIKGCINTAGDAAIQYPEEVREYCECSSDNIIKQFPANDSMKQKNLTKDQLMPYIKNCLDDFQNRISIKQKKLDN